MKRILIYFVIALLIASVTQCSSDQAKKQKESSESKVTGQKEPTSDRMEKYRAEKIAYMTANLNLTTAEAQKFWPIYNEFEKERMTSQGKRHELDRKIMETGDNIAEKEILELNHDLVQSFQDEADVVKKYNEKLMKVLPPQKVLMIYKVENQFRMEMIRKYRDRQGSGPKPPVPEQKK